MQEQPSSGIPVSAQEVETELENILASSLFRKSPRHSRFLKHVVRQTLMGEGARIKEYAIGIEVFDRSSIKGINGQDFTQTNDCPLSPQSLSPGAHCMVAVTFSPHQSGKLKAALGVRDNAPGIPPNVTLFGGAK